MSFAKFDVEAQTGSKPVPKTSQKAELLDKLSDSVSEFANNLAKFEKNLNSIGTSRDGSRLRTVLSNFHDNLSNLSRLIDSQLVDNAQFKNLQDKELFTFTKVSGEFQRLGNKFTNVQNTYHEKIKNFPVSNDQETQLILEEEEHANASAQESTPLLAQQQQQQVQQQQQRINDRDLQYHQYLIQQRSQDISQLSTGVDEINVIFKDLNNLIQQQGSQVDRIEDNLITYTNNNQFANQELVKADNYQRRKGKWCLFLLVGLILLMVIVLAVIS